MAEKTDSRPFWAITRIQGLALMAAGVVMLFFPVTNPIAPYIISVGAGWAGGGENAKVTRDKFNAEPEKK